MKTFDNEYFARLKFTHDQVKMNLANARKDLTIARKDDIPDVKFNYAYTALLKAGIALFSAHGYKVKSVSGHHFRIIEQLAQMLDDETISDVGHSMRSKRNLDLYSGGIEVTAKECREYLEFVDQVLKRVESMISGLLP